MNKFEAQVVTAKINKLKNKWCHLQNEKYNTDLIDIYIVIQDILNTIKSIINKPMPKRKPKGGCKK